jgi:mannose-6-phosphate isomerase-like protein (cupin superfamily)
MVPFPVVRGMCYRSEMAAPGEEIFNPVTGVRTVFRRTAAETGGALAEADSYWPQKPRPQAACHPALEETLEILSGSLSMWVDGREFVLRPGEKLVIPPGTPHCGWNPHEDEVHMRLQFRPALRWEFYVAEMFRLAREGQTDEEGDPEPRVVARLLDEFSREIAPVPER